MNITLTLDPGQVGYLRQILEAEALRGEQFEERVLEDGREAWDGEWPGDRIEAEHRRSAMARSILATLD